MHTCVFYWGDAVETSYQMAEPETVLFTRKHTFCHILEDLVAHNDKSNQCPKAKVFNK